MNTTVLEPPAARQGPGPIPQPLIEALDVAVNRLVGRALPGDRRAAGVGIGTELAQLRPYEIGDDVRHIDPSATARTGQAHIRLHVPERAMTTWIALDASPSMAFGTAQRLKADVAEGVALVFGRLGVRRAGSVGLVAFGAGSPRVLPPRGSKPGMVALRRMLDEGIAPDGRHEPDAMADGLQRVARLARSRTRRRALGLPAIPAQGWERPLGSLRVRPRGAGDRDPGSARGRSSSSVGLHLALVDPETGTRVEVDTSNPTPCAAASPNSERERARGAGQRAPSPGAPITVTLSTDKDWLPALGRHTAMSFAAPIWPRPAGARPGGDRRLDIGAPAGQALRHPLPGGLDAPGGDRDGHELAASPPDRARAGAAIAALALALARPHVSYSAAVNEASVMLVSDESGSMAATDVQPTRLAAAQSAANTFIDQLPGTVRVGGDRLLERAQRRAGARGRPFGGAVGDQLAEPRRRHGDRGRARPGAPAPPRQPDEAPALGNRAALRRRRQRRREPRLRRDPGQEGQGCLIYTVALGTSGGTLPNPDPLGAPLPVPPDPQLMAQIAKLSGGTSFNAQSADQLGSIYKRLGRELGTVTRTHEVTAEFAIGGIVLLLLAAVGSARWSGLLP